MWSKPDRTIELDRGTKRKVSVGGVGGGRVEMNGRWDLGEELYSDGALV